LTPLTWQIANTSGRAGKCEYRLRNCSRSIRWRPNHAIAHNREMSSTARGEPAARDAWEVAVQRAQDWPRHVTQQPVSPTLSDAEILARLAPDDFAAPRDLATLVELIADLLEHGTLHSTHPRYFGLFNPGVRPAGLLADILTAAYNLQLGAWWHAPAASRMERLALEFFARRLGVDLSIGAGVFTTGGSEANLTAVLAALVTAFPELPARGLVGLDAAPVLYASDQAHDSILKIARVTGLGDRAVRRVPSDAQQRLDVDALQDAIARDRRDRLTPFLVIATIGTTGTGAVDPIADIARVCRAECLWLHADAAWGSLAVLSDRLRPIVAGLDLADSVTADAHKILPIPMGAGMVFCRDRRATDAVFSVQTAYVPEGDPTREDLYQHTLQWSRRGIGLKVFLTLAEYGAAGVARLVEGQADMADHLRRRLEASGWTIANTTPLPLVCFTRPDLTPAQVERLAHAVAADGAAWCSSVVLPDGRRWLRACITHADTGPDDVEALVRTVTRIAAR
jgi:aromatic-L-amino-acid/L-tryptophan decarboxylase